MNGRPKKWFMLQVWRLQQVSQILTLVMLAISLALQVYNYMAWRADQPRATDLEEFLFGSPYIGAPLIMLILAAIIWGIAVIWDLRLKMWRDQATVLVERNPYSKEKMSAKEIMVYGIMWLPVLENLGKTDPKAKKAADTLRVWLQKASKEEVVMQDDLRDIFNYIGTKQDELLDLK